MARSPTAADIRDGLQLSGFFLHRFLLQPRGLDLPDSRARIVAHAEAAARAEGDAWFPCPPPDQDACMLGRLNHVAIVVPDLEAGAALYRDTLGATVSAPRAEPEHGVTVVFVELPNTKVELLEPLGENSPVRAFLERNPAGGIHHLCYEVADIIAARDRLSAAGARVLGNGEPKIGAHGKPVLFLHPKDFAGTLIELEEA